METELIVNALPFMLAAQTTLICILLLLRLRSRRESQLASRPILIAVAAYATSGLGLISIVFYITIPAVYVMLKVPVMWCFMIVNVLYFQFIFELTKIDATERFSRWHYFTPVLITLVYLIWSLLIPLDVHRLLVKSKSEIVPGYEFYSWFSHSKPLLFSIFMIAYSVMTIFRVRRFRCAVVNYSADEQRTSFSWLYQITYAMLGMAPLALALIFLSNSLLTSTPIVIIPFLFFLFRDVMLVHNILTDHFVIITPESDQNQSTQPDDKLLFIQTQNEKALRLDSYMRQVKPYLNPELKITDITADLNTNRTSLSLLINKVYGINFCRFVNRYRLEELEIIKASANKDIPEIELIAKAGFSEWRGYLRVKQREESF